MTPQLVFLLIGSIFGMLVVVINPPFKVPDELAHFYKANSVSKGQIFPAKGVEIPSSILPPSFATTVNEIHFISGRMKFKKSNITSCMGFPLMGNKSIGPGGNGAEIYPPIGYAPQALGLFLARMFSLSPILLMYMGRLFNLIAFLALVYFAIKTTPVLKWSFVLLALMPMTVILAGSLSADTMTTALSFLVIAFILKLAFDNNKKTISRKDICILMLLGILLVLTKFVYASLLLAFFIIPISKFKGKKSYFASFILIMLAVVIVGAAWVLPMQKYSKYVVTSPQIVPSKQVSFIVKNPFKYLKILFTTVNVCKEVWFAHAFGSIGWLEFSLPASLAYIYIFFTISITALDKDEIVIKLRQKAISLATVLVSCLLLFSYLYCIWTPVGYKIVAGIQGRYFLPCTPLLIVPFYNQAIKYKKTMYFYWSIIVVILFSMVVTLVKIISYFY